MESTMQESPALRTAGNENTGLLKIVAIVCMIVDHVGLVFFPRYRFMRLIGRLAFPLFCWCVVVGTQYTRNIWKYALRLLVAGIITQPCYYYALSLPWYDLNVLFTLLLGVLAIAGIREKRCGSQIWAPIGALLCSCAVSVDGGWKGVALILMLYACRRSRPAIAAMMTAFCLYWAQGTMVLTGLSNMLAVETIPLFPYIGNLLGTLIRVQFWAILALPLMLIPMKGRLRLPKWIAYAAYPAHLLVIALIRLAK